jgi:monovalent cation/hydrogen antiporter
LQRCLDGEQCGPIDRLQNLGLNAIHAEREELENLRSEDKIGPNAYLGLQEQLDWNELTLLRDSERQIEEI